MSLLLFFIFIQNYSFLLVKMHWVRTIKEEGNCSGHWSYVYHIYIVNIDICRYLVRYQPVKWLRSLGMSCNSVVIFQNWWSQRYEEGHQTKAQVGKGKHHIINSVFTSNAHAHVKFYRQFFSYYIDQSKTKNYRTQFWS